MVRNMDKWDKEREIIQSWHQNDAVWTTAVRQQQIESRVLATNQAIIDAVASKRPATVLDVGASLRLSYDSLEPAAKAIVETRACLHQPVDDEDALLKYLEPEKYEIVWEDRSTCEVQRVTLGDKLPI